MRGARKRAPSLSALRVRNLGRGNAGDIQMHEGMRGQAPEEKGPEPGAAVSEDVWVARWHVAALVVIVLVLGVTIIGRDQDYKRGYNACVTDMAGR